MSNEEIEFRKLGECPKCGKPYGYYILAVSGIIVNEYSYCICDEIRSEEKKKVA